MNITEILLSLQDMKYRDFSAKLIPNIDKERIIGVRTPAVRSLAKEMYKKGIYEEFLGDTPHFYQEENILHAALILNIKDYDKCIYRVNEFLTYIDNWAVCDMLSPKVFAKHRAELLAQIKIWLDSSEEYTIRFAIKMLMDFFLGENFLDEYADMVANVKSDKYYVNMMIAWYLATALAKNYSDTIPYMENHVLSPWTHNKTIQKACESFRVSDEHKEYLKTLKMRITE